VEGCAQQLFFLKALLQTYAVSTVLKVNFSKSMMVPRPVRLAYQPPANSTFLSEQTSHQQPARTSQQYSSLRTNQHQPSATSQPKRLINIEDSKFDLLAQTFGCSKGTLPFTYLGLPLGLTKPKVQDFLPLISKCE
jgi:hypothetical protein